MWSENKIFRMAFENLKKTGRTKVSVEDLYKEMDKIAKKNPDKMPPYISGFKYMGK